MSNLFLWGGLTCLVALPAIGATGAFNIIGAILMIIGLVFLILGR